MGNISGSRQDFHTCDYVQLFPDPLWTIVPGIPEESPWNFNFSLNISTEFAMLRNVLHDQIN